MAVARLALPPVRHASPVLIASASVSSPPAIAATPGPVSYTHLTLPTKA